MHLYSNRIKCNSPFSKTRHNTNTTVAAAKPHHSYISPSSFDENGIYLIRAPKHHNIRNKIILTKTSKKNYDEFGCSGFCKSFERRSFAYIK